jgi:hypothetical protein
VTWHSKMTWPMTWLLSGPPSGPVGHPVWPRLAPRPAPVGHPSDIPFSPCSSSPPLFAFPPDILIFSYRLCHPSSTMIWSFRFGKCSSCPPSDLPRPALPSGTPSGTLVSSRGSGRPSISEPLDRCPFGPPTGMLPYTYIKPCTPLLHHFLHSPICIRTCDYIATAPLRRSWWWGARSNCWVQTLLVFFSQFKQEKDGGA